MADNEQEGHLREAFVEMLFALAVGQVGINVADLVECAVPWQYKMPALSHLVVGLILIAASWLGWKLSPTWRRKELAKQKKHPSLFSLFFIGLLLDVTLVILYFIVVRSAEIKEVGSLPRLETPSAKPESWWIIWVFAVYVIWDLVQDVFDKGSIPAGIPLPKRPKIRVAFVSTLDSLICLVLTLLVFVVACNCVNRDAAIVLDVALICVILLFRLLKVIETPLATRLGVHDCPAFASGRMPQPHERRWRIVLAILYVVCLAATLVLFSGPSSGGIACPTA